MKVFILTEGGRDVGFGHITRCISLCQAFEERGIEQEFIINGDDTVESLLVGRKWRILNWLKENSLFAILKDASIAIVDSYLADSKFYKKLSEIADIPVFIDDNKRIDYPRGIVLNGAIYAEELDYPKRDNILYLVGSQYIPIRKEFWDVGEKEIKDNIESILVTFGGDDRRGMTPGVLNLLNEYYPECKKNVIIGSAFHHEHIEKIEKLKDKRTIFFHNPEANRLKEIMLESDIAISAGGQTLYEFARIGIPTIGICISDNQHSNLIGWAKRGFVRYIGWYVDSNLEEKLRKSIKGLKDSHIRKSISETGKRFVDGKGSRRAVKEILSDLFKEGLVLRNATFNDASSIFNLSNDEVVRRNSFNSEKIKQEDHLKWLRDKLNDSNHVFFVVTMNDMFCGQVRFDIDRQRKEATISISLTDHIRGLGLSPFVLKKSMDRLLTFNNDIKLIKAYTKEENLPSIKAFERAGFKFSKDATVNGNKARVYIKEDQLCQRLKYQVKR